VDPAVEVEARSLSHGRQDTQATAEDQEAQAGNEASYEERVVAPDRKGTKAGSRGHAFRRRELDLPDGGKLILHPDGSIAQLDGAGAAVAGWTTADAEWAGHAIRFGVLPQPATVTPPGSRSPEARPQGS
jgi:hypothetical protein